MEEIFFYILFDGNFTDFSLIEFNYLLAGIEPSLKFETIHFTNDILVIKIQEPYLKIIKIFQQYSRLSSLTKEIGLFYFSVNYQTIIDFPELMYVINEQVDTKYLAFKIDQNTSFKVELVKRGIIDGNLFNPSNRQKLIYSIADNLIKKFNLNADLNNELISIILFLTPSVIILGQRLLKPNRKLIMNRTPSNRSYFHSGSMNPILVRAMVNLGIKHHYFPAKSESKRKKIFLDPFMGAGGMLLEAGTMGYLTIGLELSYWMSRGARMNLSDLTYTGYDSFFWSILRCDSNKIPLKSNSIDLIVTDPPYGHSTILGGQTLEELLSNVLLECYRVLKDSSRMVISIPSQVTVDFIGFKILEKIIDRVHGSLTRIIYLLEK